MPETFEARLIRGDTKDTLGIVVPPDVVTALGKGQRPPVTVTIGAYTYRSTLAVMGGHSLIGVAAEHRSHLLLDGADTVTVTLALDDEPRTTPVPDDLAAALKAADVDAAFERLAPSRRKEAVRQVEGAKTQATRERRIEKVVASLSAGR